jgi:3-deoxy-D-manno-octulosonic acid (KDO) 8-phosphate synthase
MKYLARYVVSRLRTMLETLVPVIYSVSHSLQIVPANNIIG